MSRTVLVVAPHADDEVLGCAGVMMRHAALGDAVFVLIIADRIIDHKSDEQYVKRTRRIAEEVGRRVGTRQVFFSGLADERLDAPLIDVITAIEAVVEKVRPDTAYVPDVNDSDQDHRATALACRVALRAVDWVYAYEVPGPSRHFAPNYYVDLNGQLETKIELMAAYEGEMREFPSARSPEGIRTLAMLRGTECGCKSAEGFKLLKGVKR